MIEFEALKTVAMVWLYPDLQALFPLCLPPVPLLNHITELRPVLQTVPLVPVFMWLPPLRTHFHSRLCLCYRGLVSVLPNITVRIQPDAVIYRLLAPYFDSRLTERIRNRARIPICVCLVPKYMILTKGH